MPYKIRSGYIVRCLKSQANDERVHIPGRLKSEFLRKLHKRLPALTTPASTRKGIHQDLLVDADAILGAQDFGRVQGALLGSALSQLYCALRRDTIGVGPNTTRSGR